jgi:hypothetical protein
MWRGLDATRQDATPMRPCDVARHAMVRQVLTISIATPKSDAMARDDAPRWKVHGLRENAAGRRGRGGRPVG